MMEYEYVASFANRPVVKHYTSLRWDGNWLESGPARPHGDLPNIALDGDFAGWEWCWWSELHPAEEWERRRGIHWYARVHYLAHPAPSRPPNGLVLSDFIGGMGPRI
jgi:hypothetical protein